MIYWHQCTFGQVQFVLISKKGREVKNALKLRNTWMIPNKSENPLNISRSKRKRRVFCKKYFLINIGHLNNLGP